MKPTIGRIVIYRSRTGAYDVPAIVTATTETLYAPGVEGGFVPALSSPTHVHLTVLTPGIPAIGPNDSTSHAPVLPPGAASHNLAGSYQEWDIPFDETRDAHVPAGSWRWPERS